MSSIRSPKRQNRGKQRMRNYRCVLFIVVGLGLPLALIAVGGGMAAWFYLPSQLDVRSRAAAYGQYDAVLVLAGADDGRHALGAELVADGVANTLVISNPKGEDEPIGYSYCAGDKQPRGAQTRCLVPDPTTTLGEAWAVDSMAQAENWHHIVVVTNRPHTQRVRRIFNQCTDLDGDVVHIQGINYRRAPYHIAREIAGSLKFWAEDPCRD